MEDSVESDPLAVDRTFLISNEFVIKQEPQDPIPDHPEFEDEDPGDPDPETDSYAEVNFADLTFTEVDDVVLQRAVSPPSYFLPDPSEERTEDVMLYYKEKYDLKEAQIKLQRCDKIWKTLQLIKNIQSDDFPVENLKSQFNLPNSRSSRKPSRSADKSLISYVANEAGPGFRLSVKSKKKLHYCITCGKEFAHSQHLKQHALHEHGILMNVKKTCQSQEEESNEGDNEPEEALEPNIIPESTNSIDSFSSVSTRSIDNESNNEVKSECSVRTNNVKEKMKCILCKRIYADIVNHMKVYHKVGCFRPIVAQCEKVTENDPSDSAGIQNAQTSHSNENDSVQSLKVPRKRKRGMTSWTVKKKYKVSKRNAEHRFFECNVCLVKFKTFARFTNHQVLHKIRGETRENFNASKRRFSNLPQPNDVSEEKISYQRQIANFKSEGPQSSVRKSSNESLGTEESSAEQTQCECGRSFRNYHTLYLHKYKCKGTSESSQDADSSVGISIKMKKIKNDYYEVVPRNTPTEGIDKDCRNSKDSDASSNDSGMVSVDYNSQRPDSSEIIGKYDKNHSVLRIQVADDDEEIDIEDADDFNIGVLDGNNLTGNNNQNISVKNSTTSSAMELINVKEENIDWPTSTTSEEYHVVPSLRTLCNQILEKEKRSKETSACENMSIDDVSDSKTTTYIKKSNCPCGKNFKSLKYLNRHVRRYHPRLLKCNYCKTNFERIEKYFDHRCNVSEGKTYIEPIIQTRCIECQTLVDVGEQFDRHMRTHNLNSTTFQCFKCDLKFDNQHQRKNHFNIDHGYSLCRTCNKLLSIDYILKHEAYHDGLGHPCHTCKKAFDQKTLLKKHYQIAHDPSVNEVVKCLVCLKSMKLKHLKRHLSHHLHSDICKKCSKCPLSDVKVKIECNKTISDNSDNNCTALNSTTTHDESLFSDRKLDNLQDEKVNNLQENNV